MTNNFSQDLNFDEFVAVHITLFPELSAKEAECLYWLARARTAKEIAGTMYLPEGMIRKYTNRIIIKLDKESLTEVRNIYFYRFDMYNQRQTAEIRNIMLQILENTKK